MSSIQLELPFPPDEQWKDIPGYEGLYRVSNNGRLQKIGGRIKLMSPSVYKKNGYVYVGLSKNGVVSTALIHRLVMLAFAGKCPTGLVVNHKNGIKSDNRFENLEYVTPRENVMHSLYVLGKGRVKKEKIKPASRRQRGIEHPKAVLTEEDVREIRRIFGTGEYSMKQLAQLYAVSASNVSGIIKRKTWKHVE